MITLFGIPNCDSVKKARRWLDEHGVSYRFHDFRKDGLSMTMLETWLAQTEWDNLLNRRSTTWRDLPDTVRQSLDKSRAAKLLLQHPTLVKRPLLASKSGLLIGFNPDTYASFLK